MATDTDLIQGEVVEDPTTAEGDVERMLIGFLRALIDEQGSSVHAEQGSLVHAEQGAEPWQKA